jgi:hypothetical protein
MHTYQQPLYHLAITIAAMRSVAIPASSSITSIRSQWMRRRS